MIQKKALAIHDISCVGRCSLTVALPILSAAGIETAILPTAVLSTHTGGFTGYTFRDLTEDIPSIVEHWKTLGRHYDAVYTGYLGSFRQLALVEEIFDTMTDQSTLRFVDPVMADNGKLYPGFTEEFAAGMKKLCEKADVVVPNITEASLMLEIPYREEYDKAYIEDLLRNLTAMGPRMAVLTGVSFEKGKLGAAAYDKEEGRFYYYFGEEVEGYFHGTGDVFGSALLAALLSDRSLSEAIRVAVDFTLGSILRTKAEGTEARYGVDFEHGLGTISALSE